jgi:outer membrane protein insertion porin family
MDNVGGSMYWATTAELQSAIPGVPKEYGLKATAFVDAGSVFRYSGPTTFPGSAQSLQLANSNVVRSSVGAGLTWASPFGALTVDYAVPLSKAAYDVVQPLRFTAGRVLSGQRQRVMRTACATLRPVPGGARI